MLKGIISVCNAICDPNYNHQKFVASYSCNTESGKLKFDTQKNTSLGLLICGWILHENKNLKIFRMHKPEILWALMFKKFYFLLSENGVIFSVKNYKVCCKFAFTLKQKHGLKKGNEHKQR